MAADQPTRPVLELDGWSWRRVQAVDAGTLDALAARGSNRALFSLPDSVDAFAASIGRPGFGRPMLCLRDSEPVGAAAITNRSSRSQNAQLLCFFVQPERAILPLAAYVRHLFWMMPLHRVYVQLPLFEGASQYVQLLKDAAFIEEGVVKDYAVMGDRLYDVAALGVLRREFEAWCQENETRLNL